MGGMRPQGSAAELERRWRRALALLEQGESPTVIARMLGIARPSLYRWCQLASGPRGWPPDAIPALSPSSGTAAAVTTAREQCKPIWPVIGISSLRSSPAMHRNLILQNKSGRISKAIRWPIMPRPMCPLSASAWIRKRPSFRLTRNRWQRLFNIPTCPSVCEAVSLKLC